MKRIGLLLGLCLLAAGVVTEALASSPLPTTQDILVDIQMVKATKDNPARATQADHLWNDLRKVWFYRGMDSIDGKVIDALIPLLLARRFGDRVGEGPLAISPRNAKWDAGFGHDDGPSAVQNAPSVEVHRSWSKVRRGYRAHPPVGSIQAVVRLVGFGSRAATSM